MTRCVLYTHEGQVIGFLCAGHAAYAEEGRDIVCSAVSVLTETCVNALESVCGLRPEARVSKGSMRVRIPADAGHDAQVVLGVLRQGLSDLQEQYPDLIAINETTMEE